MDYEGGLRGVLLLERKRTRSLAFCRVYIAFETIDYGTY